MAIAPEGVDLLSADNSVSLNLGSHTVVINEVDADQDGTDSAEFIELFDGGAGNTDLRGLVVVLFNP